MSTDDLTARVHDHLAHADTLPRGLAISLVSDLADEVDRLRAENERLASIEFIHNGCETIRRRDVQAVLDQRDEARAEADRFRTLWDRHGKNDLLAERDAARAALERVTDLLTLWARLASQQANLGDVVLDLTRALEGEP